RRQSSRRRSPSPTACSASVSSPYGEPTRANCAKDLPPTRAPRFDAGCLRGDLLAVVLPGPLLRRADTCAVGHARPCLRHDRILQLRRFEERPSTAPCKQRLAFALRLWRALAPALLLPLHCFLC